MSDLIASPSATSGRSRLLAIGVVTSVVNRGVAALVPLLVIPIALGQLGVTGYGAWATALSVTSLVAFADLGIGTGLMTRLGRGTDESGGSESQRVQVSSAYAMVGVVAGCLLAALLLSALALDWGQILGATSRSDNVEVIFLVTVSAFLVNMVASLVVRVQYGVGQQGPSNLWQATGSVVMLVAVWVTSETTPRFEPFIVVAAFAPVTVATLNSLTFFAFSARGRSLTPTPTLVDRTVAVGLLRLGSKFLLISVLMTMSLALDPLIVAHTSTLADVSDYAIPHRIFTVVGTLAVMSALPLWPLNAGAVAAGDVAWIRRTTLRMTIGSAAIVALGSAIVVGIGPGLVDRWLNERIDVDLVLWSGLAVWWIVQTLTGPAFMVQNGAEVLRPQLLGYALLLIVLPAKAIVSAHLGYEWIPWVGAALYCLVMWPACRAGYLQALQRAETATVGKAR